KRRPRGLRFALGLAADAGQQGCRIIPSFRGLVVLVAFDPRFGGPQAIFGTNETLAEPNGPWRVMLDHRQRSNPWGSVAEEPIALPPAPSGSASMPSVYRIIRLSNTMKGLEDRHTEHAWATIREARKMLADIPCPDTFLGRKTQEPFPNEKKSPARL